MLLSHFRPHTAPSSLLFNTKQINLVDICVIGTFVQRVSDSGQKFELFLLLNVLTLCKPSLLAV